MHDDAGRVLDYGHRAANEPAQRVLEDRTFANGKKVVDAGAGAVDSNGVPQEKRRKISPPFLFTDPEVRFRSNPLLSEKISSLLHQEPYLSDYFCFSIIDLTPNETSSLPVVAGYRMEQTAYIASMAKLAIFMAAMALRTDVRKTLTAFDWKDQESAFSQIEKSWRPQIEKKFAGGTKDFPALSEVFSVKGSSADFKEDKLEFLNPGFFVEMSRMMQWSENSSATFCLRKIGYQYLHGAMEAFNFLPRYYRKKIFINKDFSSPGHWDDKKSNDMSHLANAVTCASMMYAMVRKYEELGVMPSDLAPLSGRNNTYFLRGLENDEKAKQVQKFYDKIGDWKGGGITYLSDTVYLERKVDLVENNINYEENVSYILSLISEMPNTVAGRELNHHAIFDDMSLKLDRAISSLHRKPI